MKKPEDLLKKIGSIDDQIASLLAQKRQSSSKLVKEERRLQNLRYTITGRIVSEWSAHKPERETWLADRLRDGLKTKRDRALFPLLWLPQESGMTAETKTSESHNSAV